MSFLELLSKPSGQEVPKHKSPGQKEDRVPQKEDGVGPLGCGLCFVAIKDPHLPAHSSLPSRTREHRVPGRPASRSLCSFPTKSRLTVAWIPKAPHCAAEFILLPPSVGSLSSCKIKPQPRIYGCGQTQCPPHQNGRHGALFSPFHGVPQQLSS